MEMFVNGDLVGSKIDGGIGIAKMKIAEIVADHLRSESEAQHETPESVTGVDLHDMPKDRMFTNGDHGLWPKFSFFLDARAQAAAEDENRDIGRFVHVVSS
jgi:hypothetical protein